MKYIRTSFFKQTSDDWSPNYLVRIPPHRTEPDAAVSEDMRLKGQEFVQVTLISPLQDGKTHRVCVWGADDRGMEYDTEDPMDARKCYWAVAFLSILSRRGLEVLGFKPA